MSSYSSFVCVLCIVFCQDCIKESKLEQDNEWLKNQVLLKRNAMAKPSELSSMDLEEPL